MASTTFPQVSGICAGREESLYISGTYRRDLRGYALEVQAQPSSTRQRRHRIEAATEMRGKLIAETGFDQAGIMCEPPAEQWTRPEAQPLYHKLMQRVPGKPSISDYEGEDLRHLAWMLDAELIDIDPEGVIWMLSDAEPPSRKYPGAPVGDDRARIGRTHSTEEAEALVLEVWQMIVDGRPVVDIDAEYRQEMIAGEGLRVSGRMIAGHVNRLLASRLDMTCNCLGRDQVTNAWDLRDHGEDCLGRWRWMHVETVRRAVRSLVKSLGLRRTSGAILTRRGHTEWRIPCAYAIPADAGWHKYAAVQPVRRRRRHSVLRKRLLGSATAARTPAHDPWAAEAV